MWDQLLGRTAASDAQLPAAPSALLGWGSEGSGTSRGLGQVQEVGAPWSLKKRQLRWAPMPQASLRGVAAAYSPDFTHWIFWNNPRPQRAGRDNPSLQGTGSVPKDFRGPLVGLVWS